LNCKMVCCNKSSSNENSSSGITHKKSASSVEFFLHQSNQFDLNSRLGNGNVSLTYFYFFGIRA
jgi:hypothetical protein